MSLTLQIIQAVVSVAMVTLIYVAKQARLKVRKLQAVIEPINEIGNEDIRELRDWALYSMPSINELNAKQKWDARRLAIAYDRLGYMMKRKLIEFNEIVGLQGDVIVPLWNKLKPVIYERRENNRPRYCQNFQYLAEKLVSKQNR